MRRTALVTSVLAAGCALALPVLTPTPADAARAPACRGAVATEVGSPGAVVRGRKGRDVIVTAGARKVVAGAGNDLVCVTGYARKVSVGGGRGNDRVFVLSSRVRVAFASGRGSDAYIGNGRSDVVELTADGLDRVNTRAGDDEVSVSAASDGGRAKLQMSPGRDAVSIDSGGGGDVGADEVFGDLSEGDALLRDSTSTRAATVFLDGVDDLTVTDFPRAAMKGNAGDNELVVEGSCASSLLGLGGDDVLRSTTTSTPPGCGGAAGAATSEADGGEGFDRCLAIRRVACEEVLTS